jgi:hypothetical protein
MPKYAFLSDEWVAEAKRIYAETGTGGAAAGGAGLAPVRVNLVVTDAPFSPAPIDAHVDTSAGGFDIDVGHVPEPDVTISLGYDTARSLFVQGDVQAVLQAFLGGRIKVDGDLSKLLDPRSGIFPGSGGTTSPGPGFANPGAASQGGGESAPAATGGPPGANQGPFGQQGFGFGGQHAMQVATRLQEITE